MIHEPMTVATDYLLTAASLVFAHRLWRAGQRAWSWAFLFTAAGAFAGGTWHGFAPQLASWASVVLWKVTVLSVGAASASLLVAASRRMAPLAIAKFVVYASWMAFHDDFIYVIADYGLTMVIVAVVFAAGWFTQRDRRAPWVLGSIAVAAIAAGVQASGFSLHRHFNHNDLYHVVQLVALWLMYRGGGAGEARN